MIAETFKSEDARNRWRDMMDIAIMGGRVIVERYAKPQAVLVGYTQYKEMAERLDELEAWAAAMESKRAIDSGEARTVTLDQHKARMRTKGAKYVGDPV